MRHIDEDTITQAVIARHAAAGDARLREVVTSLVQHLHAFAREVKLSEAEWAEGVRFLTECGRLSGERRQEVALLSDALGLSTLVSAQNHRAAKGATEPSAPGALRADATPAAAEAGRGGEPCFVRGSVRTRDGAPIAGAEVKVWPSGEGDGPEVQRTSAGGAFECRAVVPEPLPIPHDGPVGRLLAALGRHPWRPAHLHFMVSAPGYERLVTHVFRRGSQYLDSDAVFGVRSSLVADWVRHEPGRTPGGGTSEQPFYTLDFDFVLHKA
jgi:hydroxyquinol 1,2-dioxygenase